MPLSVRFDVPFLIRPPAPLTTPASVRLLLPVLLRLALITTLLPRLSALLLSSAEAPATVRLPRPSAELLPTIRVPALRVVPPRKLL